MTRHILVVDDEDHIREIAAMSLNVVGGWDVSTASDGDKALELAVSARPDAILLDVMMPGMDGPTTLIALRADKRTKNIPVLFLTAKVQAAEIDRLSKLGACAILSKPFDPLLLHRQIAEALKWQ